MFHPNDVNSSALIFSYNGGKFGTHYGEFRHYVLSPNNDGLILTFYWGFITIAGQNLAPAAEYIDKQQSITFTEDPENSQKSVNSPISEIKVNYYEDREQE